jgi:hypothetical protein
MKFKKDDWVYSKVKRYMILPYKNYKVLDILVFFDEYILIIDETGATVGEFANNFELSPENNILQRKDKLKKLNG